MGPVSSSWNSICFFCFFGCLCSSRHNVIDELRRQVQERHLPRLTNALRHFSVAGKGLCDAENLKALASEHHCVKYRAQSGAPLAEPFRHSPEQPNGALKVDTDYTHCLASERGLNGKGGSRTSSALSRRAFLFSRVLPHLQTPYVRQTRIVQLRCPSIHTLLPLHGFPCFFFFLLSD